MNNINIVFGTDEKGKDRWAFFLADVEINHLPDVAYLGIIDPSTAGC